MLPGRKTRYLLMKKVLDASGVFMKAPVPAPWLLVSRFSLEETKGLGQAVGKTTGGIK